MIFISIMILIVAIALHSLSPVILTRISAIVFIYAGVLSFNAFDIQSIGSGIGIYSGLFQITTISQLLDTFIFIIGSLILVSWPILLNKSPISQKLENTKLETSKEDLTNLNRLVQIKLNKAGEYSLIVLFSALGASLLMSSSDLISMYLSIELQSFGVYILSTLYRNSESATSAGLKYFLLGSLSSCLILLGIGLIYSFTGLTNLESIYSLVSVSDSTNITQGLNLGLIIIIIGFLFKISAAPLHHWAPDVYDDSPTIVTIWLTIMPKISILIFLIELQTQLGLIGNSITLPSLGGVIEVLDTVNNLNNTIITNNLSILPTINTTIVLKNLLLVSSLLSLIIGTVVGLAQSKIKRLLSYSTISHIGFILLALAINTEQSIDSLLFYIIQYSITNLNTFLILIALGYIINSYKFNNHSPKLYPFSSSAPSSSTSSLDENGNIYTEEGKDSVKVRVEQNDKGFNFDIKFISELKGQFFSNPLLSLSLTVCLLSMAGIPPLLGFFSKQFVLYSAIQSGYYFMSIVAIIVSVISASYYLKIIKVLHSSNVEEAKELTITNTENELNSITNTETIVSNFHSFLISTLTLSILLFVLKPSILLNSTQLLSLSIFNY